MRSTHQFGYSILELMAVLGLISVVSSIVVSNIRTLENPLTNTSANIAHYFRLVRARAISQTRSITVTPSNSRTFLARSAKNCTDTTTTAEDSLTLTLDSEASLESTSWSVCFTQRGLVDDSVEFGVRVQGRSKTVEIALGGGVRIQ